MNSHVLHPGEYFIELEFDRLVDPAVLHRALTSMGFGVVVFDQSLPTVEVGALASVAALSSVKSALATKSAYSLAAPATAAKTSLASVALAAAKPMASAVASPLNPIAAAIAPPKPTVVPIQSRYTAPKPATAISVVAAKKPVSYADGGGIAALKPSATVTAVADMAKRAGYSTVVTKPGLTGPAAYATPAGSVTAVPTKTGPAFPGNVAAPATPAPPEPKAEFMPVASDGGGGGYVSDPQYEPPAEEPMQQQAPPAEQPAPMPVQQAASPSEPVTVAQKLMDLWSRWKEWGSPFATGPMTTVSGAGDDDPLRFRVLARLDRPIALDDRPGMRWLFVKALSVPFLSDLVFKSHPHPLHEGSLYEIRFLSRAKSNPTRESVKQALVEMGFQPVKLSAIKRNMKLPNRPASLTLWYGMAVWKHADSVIINDDPFFFETVKEIRPS